MIIIEDIEPPHERNQKTKKFLRKLFQNKTYQNNKLIQKCFSITSKAFFSLKKLFLVLTKEVTEMNRKLVTNIGFRLIIPNLKKAVKKIGQILSTNDGLAHLAAGSVILIVLLTNIAAILGQAKLHPLRAADPESKIAVSNTIDQFTPMIEDDSMKVEKSYTSSSEGFYDIKITLATVYTEREEPLPDNSQKTVYYQVRNGDNLTTLAWKFDVNVATIKYYNDLSNIDYIKPGQNLKVPPQGHNVSLAMINKKAKDKEQKRLAAERRRTSTQTSSSSRYSTSSTSSSYVRGNVRYLYRSWGQCYTWVTSQGYNVSGYHLAKRIPTNSRYPRVGGLVVTYESWAGHVGIVVAVHGDGTFTLRDRNYAAGWVTERRMGVNDRVVKGFRN